MPYYAFKNENQLFDNWADCEAAVKGYRNATYKKFKHENDARTWLAGTTDNNDIFTYKHKGISGTVTLMGDTGDLTSIPRPGLVIATDGSFNPDTGIYGGAALIVDDDLKLIQPLTIHGSDDTLAGSQNVSGEILAFCNAIAYAVNQGAKTLTVIHDYEGIYQVATNGYKKITSKSLKKEQKALAYAKDHGLTTINFIWVNSHKGFPINELADHYAKKAVGLA